MSTTDAEDSDNGSDEGEGSKESFEEGPDDVWIARRLR